MVDEKVHDSFRNLVGGAFADNVEVGGYEGTYEIGLEGFTLCEFGWRVVLEGLGGVR